MLLAVALHSLEKHYSGNTHIVYGTSVPPWFIDILKKYPKVSLQPSTHKAAGSGHIHAYNVRPQVHLDMPFDVRVMFDCDHVFVGPVKESMWEYASQHGLGSFGWPLNMIRWSGRIKAEKVAMAVRAIPLPCVSPLPPSAGNCVCSRKGGEEMIRYWDDQIKLFVQQKSCLGSKFADSHALSYALHHHKVPIGDWRVSYSGQVASQSDIRVIPQDITAIHFGHGRFKRREADHVYGKELGEAIQKDFLGLSSEIRRYAEAHPDLKVYGARMVAEKSPNHEIIQRALKHA